MRYRVFLCLAALMLTALAVLRCLMLPHLPERLPGAEAPQRRLVRVWVCSSVGGGESWLRQSLKAWEKKNPGIMTFLRVVTTDELTREGTVLPDVLLYTPGTLTAPQEWFVPLNNVAGIREPLLRAGRWQNQQYALPLCYAGYALAIDSAAEPQPAATPAPTTLLGRPAATAEAASSPTPGIPENAGILAPGGCGLFTLGILASDSAPPASTMEQNSVYQQFRARQAAAALLTTGQITALQGTFPFRVITPGEVITDQVFMASLFPGAEACAADLLAYLISPECQRTLSQQGLYTVREDLRLYAAGTEGLMETAAARLLTAINAYIPKEETDAAAWQYIQGQQGLSTALTPLL